jgi:sulfur-oxidizing protein SoxA
MRFAWFLAMIVAVVALGLATHPSNTAAQTAAVPLALDGDAAARPWRRYPEWPQRDSAKFNTLAAPASPPAPKEPRKLTRPITGDPALGAKLAADRTRGGSCLACHVMGSAGGADLPGNVGPDLSEIGNANKRRRDAL